MKQDTFQRLLDFGLHSHQSAGIGDRIHVDFILLFLLFSISAYGLVILYSAVDQDFEAVTVQIVKIFVATVVMLTVAQISPFFYLRTAWWLFIFGVLLLVVVYFFGYEVNGSKRWLRIPGCDRFSTI